MGEEITDTCGAEGGESIKGMGLLPVVTSFEEEKWRRQREGRVAELSGAFAALSGMMVKGYEIHMGRTMDMEATISHPIQLTARAGKPCQTIHGSARADGLVWGTYMHGIFDNDAFRRAIINALRINKRLQPLPVSRNYRAEKQKNYDRLAHIVRQHMHMDVLRTIMKERTKP